MEFINKIVGVLKKPFPEQEVRSIYFRNIIVVSAFVTFFLYIFQPFGIASLDANTFWVCLGFGAMTFIGSFVYDGIFHRIRQFKKEKTPFTFGHWILDIIGIILTISLANFLFARSLMGSIRWEFLPQMIYGTFAIGIFPMVVLGAINLLRLERKFQNIADEINHQDHPLTEDSNNTGQSLFDIPINRIKYIEALQNYVKIGYLNQNGQLSEQTERATLKSILNEVQGSNIVKCHKSFLVNRSAIIDTAGNAQGLVLSLSGCDKKIPVSRSWVSIFRATKSQ